jgi:hypothetical protein
MMQEYQKGDRVLVQVSESEQDTAIVLGYDSYDDEYHIRYEHISWTIDEMGVGPFDDQWVKASAILGKV